MKKTIAILAVLATSACTNAHDSKQALAEAGFSDIHVGGFAWLQCGKDDTFATKFSAKGPTGVPVRGAVCCGLMKGCTIRH
jgi:hypothetical protein